MVLFKDNHDINLIEHLKGSFVYVNKEDIKEDDGEILAVNLISYDVFCNDKKIGIIEDVIDNGATEIIVLDNNVMIPYVDTFIKEINKDNKKVVINDVKGLID